MDNILDNIDWNKNPLIPAIAQDEKTLEVLMLAYMNKEALGLTLKTNIAHYFSRSKNRIWKKGESSGHTQEVKSLSLDCDKDTILMNVKQNGVACHTGAKSCFFNHIIKGITSAKNDSVIQKLHQTIQERKNADPRKSYTAHLFSKGENEILKKISEECGEFIISYKDNNKEEIIHEISDLIYHSLVSLAYKDISLEDISLSLLKRFQISGIEEKNNRTQ